MMSYAHKPDVCNRQLIDISPAPPAQQRTRYMLDLDVREDKHVHPTEAEAVRIQKSYHTVISHAAVAPAGPLMSAVLAATISATCAGVNLFVRSML